MKTERRIEMKRFALLLSCMVLGLGLVVPALAADYDHYMRTQE